MKKIVTNILTTTGITLIILAVIGTLYGGKFLFISGVFQSLGANIAIHLGYLLTRKFESKYVALEAVLEIGYTVMVAIVFGAIFDWFSKGTPIWILVIMAVLIYLFGLLLSLREDINTINQLLQKRGKKNNK